MESRREAFLCSLRFIVLLLCSTVFQLTCTSDQVLPTTTTTTTKTTTADTKTTPTDTTTLFSEKKYSDENFSENVFSDFDKSEDFDETPVPLEGLTFPLKNGLGPICRFNETDPLCDRTTTRVFSSRYR